VGDGNEYWPDIGYMRVVMAPQFGYEVYIYDEVILVVPTHPTSLEFLSPIPHIYECVLAKGNFDKTKEVAVEGFGLLHTTIRIGCLNRKERSLSLSTY